MRRPFASLFVLALLCATAFGSPINQSEVCYQQCAAQELVWQDDYCWGMFNHFCSMDEKDVGIQLAGAWASYVTKGADFTFIINPIMCVKLVDDCIRPVLSSCRSYCEYNDVGYAPDLFVKSSWYDEEEGLIHFRIRNGGLAYMPGANATFLAAVSDDGMMEDKDFKSVQTTIIPALRPSDARLTFNLDNECELVFPWRPKDGKYNAARLIISPDPRFKERSAINNKHDHIVDNLPLPAEVRLTHWGYEREEPYTNSFVIRSVSNNTGQSSASVRVELYLGNPNEGRLIGTDEFTLDGGEGHGSVFYMYFPDPSVQYVVIRQIVDGVPGAEPWIFPNPQHVIVRGKVTDETGRPIADAIVTDLPTLYPNMPVGTLSTRSDGRGNYELKYYTLERAVILKGIHHGYFTNTTGFRVVYGDPSNRSFSDPLILYRDIVMTQFPLTIDIGYPEHGRFIVESDKGRLTGDFFPNNAFPFKGNDAALAVYSERCSPFIVDHTFDNMSGSINASQVRCLDADANDDYAILGSQSLLFQKEYQKETPLKIFFDRRGDHAYVVTADQGDPLCNLYSYSLPSGDQLYRKELGALCGQGFSLIPAYDGSSVYVGLGVHGGMKYGINRSMGLILDASGQTLESWEYEPHLTNLAHASASEFLELRMDPLLTYKGERRDMCLAIGADTCGESGHRYSIDILGLSKNRAIGDCNGTPCVFMLGDDDFLPIPRFEVNSMVSGNYLNYDFFIGGYKGGSYLSGGQALWNVDQSISHLSMSPGGRYVLVALDPYGLALYDPQGTDITPQDARKASARGSMASERGLFYGTTKGGMVSIYALSTLTEPTSGSSSEGSESLFMRAAQAFEYLLEGFLGFVSYLKSLLGL